MPSLGENNFLRSYSTSSMSCAGSRLVHSMEKEKENRCGCCPFGYHIDRDFVPFTKRMLSREGDVERLQELKEKWRSERQSMDSLLGIHSNSENLWKDNFSKNSQETWRKEKIIEETYERNQVYQLKDLKRNNQRDLDIENQQSSPTSFYSSEKSLIGNGLQEAVNDFEEALRKTGPQAGVLAYTVPDNQKYHTFPRQRPIPSRESGEELATNLIMKKDSSHSSSINRASMKDITTRYHEECKNGLNLNTQMMSSYSSDSRKRANERERLKMLEEQVKLIPKLQSKVSKLKEDNEELRHKLNEEKRPHSSEFDYALPHLRTNINGHSSYQKNLQNDIAVGNHVFTRDIGISSRSNDTRSIGVSAYFLEQTDKRSLEESSPTGSLYGTLSKKRLGRNYFDVGIQVQDRDLGIQPSLMPVLQIIEKIDTSSQTAEDLSINRLSSSLDSSSEDKSIKSSRNVGVSAKPRTTDFGATHKPKCKDCSSNTTLVTTKSNSTRSFGVNVQMDKEKVKSSRSISVNTDKAKYKAIGTNTAPPIKKTHSTQTIDRIDSEFSKRSPSVERVAEVRPSPPPRDITRSLSPVPLSPSSPILISKIPRLTSPVSSPKGLTKSLYQNTEKFELASGSKGSLVKKSSLFGKQSEQETEEENEGIEVASGRIERVDNPSFVFSPIIEERESKIVPSKEMQGALKVLNDSLLRGKTTTQVTSAIQIIMNEWFRISGTKEAHPLDVEDYLDNFESYSPQLLRYVVNMPDRNGNTALHYSVSHGNFDVVSILLDSKVCDPNKANKAGYTPLMLVSLAQVETEAHRHVVRRLFNLGDVNIKAAQHGQTALMLAASHGRLDTLMLLLEAGADINIQDSDGSTALMCAAEHGHGEIVKCILSQPDCDLDVLDNDGNNALTVAMEAKNKDIGVMIYAHMHFLRKSPSNASGSPKSRGSTPRTPSRTPSSSPDNSPWKKRKEDNNENKPPKT